MSNNDGALTCIKDLRTGMKNLNVQFIILDIAKATKTRDGHTVRCCKVADRSGSINASLWDDFGEFVQTGDICRITKGYSTVFNRCLTLYVGKGGEIKKLGEFCMLFSEVPNMSDPVPDPAPQNQPVKSD